VYRDYGPKGVKFFFIYKSLAHPELVGGHVQSFTLPERLAHARQAEQRLGATIPWMVDAIDNRLKHALGDRPNSEFIIDPKGRVAVKRAWSHPAEVRKDLERLVGPVERVTKESDVVLKFVPPTKAPAATGVVSRLKRPRMQPIAIEPIIDPKGPPFYAKLRAEADADLMMDGFGKLYLGFHLDPIHEAHWNNLTEPLSFKLELPEGSKFAASQGTAAKVDATSDADPREFLIDVKNWPDGKPIRLKVTYAACVGEKACHQVSQEYVLRLKRDRDGGGARGEGAGFWDPVAFGKQMMARDKNKDGKLNESEVQGLVRPHFAHFDTNKDGLLDLHELKAVSDWLNRHHEPGAMPAKKGK